MNDDRDDRWRMVEYQLSRRGALQEALSHYHCESGEDTLEAIEAALKGCRVRFHCARCQSRGESWRHEGLVLGLRCPECGGEEELC